MGPPGCGLVHPHTAQLWGWAGSSTVTALVVVTRGLGQPHILHSPSSKASAQHSLSTQNGCSVVLGTLLSSSSFSLPLF